jgi:hypothetical protein
MTTTQTTQKKNDPQQKNVHRTRRFWLLTHDIRHLPKANFNPLRLVGPSGGGDNQILPLPPLRSPLPSST